MRLNQKLNFMAKTSKIEWTEAVWNPSVGCTKISEGCKYCYAETFARRLQAMGMKGYEQGFKFHILPERLNEPYKQKKPTIFFVNSTKRCPGITWIRFLKL